MDFLSILGTIVSPITNLIDELHTSEEEKGKLRVAAMSTQVGMGAKMLEYNTKILELQQAVIVAEAKSDSWLTRSWRPITMMVFLGLVVSYWLGYTPENITKEELGWVMDLIKIGLGGYVIGRSVEKVAPSVINAFKDKG